MNRRRFLTWLGLAPVGLPLALKTAAEVPAEGSVLGSAIGWGTTIKNCAGTDWSPPNKFVVECGDSVEVFPPEYNLAPPELFENLIVNEDDAGFYINRHDGIVHSMAADATEGALLGKKPFLIVDDEGSGP